MYLCPVKFCWQFFEPLSRQFSLRLHWHNVCLLNSLSHEWVRVSLGAPFIRPCATSSFVNYLSWGRKDDCVKALNLANRGCSFSAWQCSTAYTHQDKGDNCLIRWDNFTTSQYSPDLHYHFFSPIYIEFASMLSTHTHTHTYIYIYIYIYIYECVYIYIWLS